MWLQYVFILVKETTTIFGQPATATDAKKRLDK